MAIEYEIIEDKRLVVAKGSGVVTGNDVISHLDTLAADERYVAPMKKLVDYSSIDSMRLSNEEIITIAQKKEALKSKFAGERCAFVSHETLLSHAPTSAAVRVSRPPPPASSEQRFRPAIGASWPSSTGAWR